ncbi:isopentenyl-diphosphate Delta-isomerase 1-like [Anthonomus grandis grandis]|uniref:isopentenyl-diphosphate Delta-isomerase 1-like n=1 Tax=Anthonomus grandis grandis TaxID=2921223 RepID=UPI002165568F|nr:isopentenyl-diphosphate Delta-isomerase 1-like [Anthonomus grandis grandis]
MLSSIGRNISRHFCKNFTSSAFASVAANSKTSDVDPQHEAMLKDQCFLVDENDKIIGQASKRDCHLVSKDGTIPLHRAFSVFLFNKKGDLLLQKRSSEKLTFPDCYTNSCCSHPLANFPGEEEEQDSLGVKKAALRRLNFELGIPLDSIGIDNIHYITRVHYFDEGNGKYGEHEIDYVLFIQQDVKLKPNSHEVSEISFIPRTEFDDFIPTLTGQWTPWFALILKHRLKYWWDNLNNLEEIKDHSKILRFTKKPEK